MLVIHKFLLNFPIVAGILNMQKTMTDFVCLRCSQPSSDYVGFSVIHQSQRDETRHLLAVGASIYSVRKIKKIRLQAGLLLQLKLEKTLDIETRNRS